MKSALELLKAYEKAPTRPSTRVDPATWMILVMAIYDDRNGEWAHNFLVREGHLPALKGNAHTSQLRKVHRWRAAVELEIGLPRRARGKATTDYHRKRRLWENANPRPTPEMLLDGWFPALVNFDLETHPETRPETKQETKKQTPPETKQQTPAATSPDLKAEPEDTQELTMAQRMQIVSDKAKAGTLKGEPTYTPPTFVPVSQPRKRRPPNT